jgi:hypothetical protein
MSRPSNYFTELAGVPVNYDRLPPPHNYGTRGTPTRFHTTEEFQEKLDACFAELWTVCPLGQAELITSAGAYTAKPGYHGRGRAFDLDCMFWSDRTFITVDYQTDARFYLGVESIVRKYFGTVLNYNYNASHRDHFHIDDGTEVGFRRVRSILLFTQAVLTEIYDDPVEIDGQYGSETADALDRVLATIDIETDLSQTTNWLSFLNATAARAFDLATTSVTDDTKNPLELLNDLYGVIERELADSESRKRIETVLNRFADHQETEVWLETYRG